MRRFGWTEYGVAIVVFATVFAMLTSFKLIRSDQDGGDSAMYFQGIENLASRGAAVSQTQASIVDYLNLNRYLATPTEEFVKDPVPLFGRPAAASERSLFLGHAYFILYPIAALVRVFPVRNVLFSLFVFTFTGVVLLAYFTLRSKGVSIAGAFLFCLLIVTQPAWWEGLLWGQFYPDRCFILAGFIFMGLASLGAPQMGKISNRVWLLIAALVCASINERGAIVAGMFLLLYVILYWKKSGLDRYYKLALSVALLCYGLIVVKLLLPTASDYGTFLPMSLSAVLSTLQQPRFVPLVTLFLLVNAPLFCLALFEWRAALIAAILMGPNIFGTIGGAEKIGWMTHYPSFFFPSLVWAGLIGYSALFEKAKSNKLLPAVYVLTGTLMLFLSMVNPGSIDPISINFSNATESVFPSFGEAAQRYLFQTSSRQSLEEAADGISRAVPPNTVVSSVEGGMPLLYKDRTIEYFPKDIDNADYAVLGAQMIDGKITYNGALSYVGADEQKKLNDLVLSRMKRDGYDVDHPKLFPAFKGLAVVRRVH
jgi:hypothetical protein